MTHCQQQKENSCGKWQKIKNVISALKGLILTVPTVLVLLAMLGAWGCRFVAPSTFMPIAYLGLGFPIILICYLLWISILIIFGGKKQLLMLIPTVICFPIMWDTFPINISGEESHSDSTNIKLATYNVCAFWQVADAPNLIAEMLTQEDPDIICLQEYIDFRANSDPKFSALLKKYPYSTVGDASLDSYNRVVTLSKNKIVQSGMASKGKGINKAIYSDIVFGNDTIRIVNAHLASNHISRTDKEEIDSLSHGLKLDKTKEKINTFSKKMKDNYIIREQMVNDIDSVRSSTKLKMIICGDFNDVPVSYVYNTLKGDVMSVANEEKGWGYNYTFNEAPFFFSLDHVLYQTDKFDCIYIKREKVLYSDHYPSIVQLSIKQ